MDNSNNKKVDTPSQEKSQNELAPMMALYDPRYYSSAPFCNPNMESMKPLPSIKVELSPIKDILPSISSAEVASRPPFDYALPSFLTKPEPPPLLPRITSLLSPESIPQARKLPSSPSPSPNASPLIPPIQSTKQQWKQDDVSDVAIALEQLRSIAQGRPSEPEPTLYSNDSDVSPPNEVEDSLDSRKRPLAAVGTPVIITTIQTSTGEITSSFIKAKPKKKRRKAEQIDRKFPCDYLGCPKSYGSEGALKTHRRLKHPELPVDGQIIQTQPTSTTPTALQHVQAVQIHPSQLLQHYANGGSIVQLLPPPQVLNSSPMQGSVLTLVHQPTPNTVA